MVSSDSDQKGGSVELTHMIDIGSWQFMLDSLSGQLGAGVRIANEKRETVLQSGVAALCHEAIRREAKHPACFRCCDIEDLLGYEHGGFALCPYCERAINFVFNVRVDGIQGAVVIGPVWVAEEGRPPALARLARKFGIGQTKFAQLSGQLKAYSLEEFRKAGETVLSTMRVIAQVLGTNLELVSLVSQLKESLMSERKRNWQQIVKDGLTGAYRYNYGLARLKEEVARAERYNQSLSIVVVGIEEFRAYVARCGPVAANTFLRNIGSTVQKKCRRTDLPVRLSEEDFLLILPFTPEEGAEAVLSRIRDEVSAFPVSDEHGGAVKPPPLMEGIASYPKDGREGKELLRKALEKRHA